MKSILISGASGNMGKCVVEQLHQDGYHIKAIVSSENDLAGFKHLQNVEASIVDVLNETQVSDFLAKNTEDFEAALLLVGGFGAGTLLETDVSQIEKMFQLNFVTAFNIVQPLFAKFMQQGSGQFIFVGARPALNAQEGQHLFAYSLSKSMVLKMAELVNAMGKDHNIRATVIVPSIMDTPHNRRSMPDADFSHWVTAEAVAKTMSFALSEEGKMLNEPILKVYNRA